MKRDLVIGFMGHKGAGKDTAASMMSYIIKTGSSSRFNDWLLKYDKEGIDIDGKIAFGDIVKSFLSKSLNIDIRFFNSRVHKDEFWYCFKDNTFISTEKVIKYRNDYSIVDMSDLNNYSIDYIIKHFNNPIVKLRSLLQWFGTNIIRNRFYENAWVNIAVNDAKEILKRKHFVLFTDVRFDNEREAIKKLNGSIIEIRRNIVDNNTDNHPSEQFDFVGDYIINNDSSKLALFYAILDVYNKITNK